MSYILAASTTARDIAASCTPTPTLLKIVTSPLRTSSIRSVRGDHLSVFSKFMSSPSSTRSDALTLPSITSPASTYMYSEYQQGWRRFNDYETTERRRTKTPFLKSTTSLDARLTRSVSISCLGSDEAIILKANIIKAYIAGV